ncbi:MAG TPA: carotenoid biosynthesis protein [Candidatus Hydrogenedentes bacterium]|nr:carotenoid biosynthesis protein [Candidatus Hydrogenedentota bacterium]HQE82658.1 carotenoid biosynthesis protein [Candidatus Hydrogenedentota bacterium]HQH52770.1 carotenoid biosynthesis protein [Candidatus Hydrogenedentota bacterium]HQM50032.1 carotenoid biosynthesis protein [Candidatus Hydrogenedentota bacterium]
MKRRLLLGMLVIPYAVLWAGGMVSYVVSGQPEEHMRWAGPLFMMLAAVLVLICSTKRYQMALVIGGLAGFAAEILGVWTGFPFGEYQYTQAFAPLLLGVPLVMVCAWAVLAGYLDVLLRPFIRHPMVLALAGAAGLTAIDLVLDPVAAGPMRLWQWGHAGLYYGIPISNFAGWFGTGFVVSGVLSAVGRREKVSPALRIIGLSLVVFFTVIALGSRLFVPGCWGLALCVAHVILVHAAKGRGGCAEASAEGCGKPDRD